MTEEKNGSLEEVQCSEQKALAEESTERGVQAGTAQCTEAEAPSGCRQESEEGTQAEPGQEALPAERLDTETGLSAEDTKAEEKPVTYRERRQKEKEAAAVQKAERKEEKQKIQSEKKEARNVVRKERSREVRSLLHTAEIAILVTFVVLAIDQVGVNGFLFVWLFIALMVASIALLLLGLAFAARKKRCGIIFFVAVTGILVCAGWFLFLFFSQGLGLGPVPS